MRSISRALPALVLLLACAAGVYARFLGLGERTLAVDEYYFLTGVSAIVREGLPVFATGGYYTHGLTAQYASAASILLLGDTNFAARLPPVLFGLGSAALLFVYARRSLGGALAATLATLLLVSSWEIEFARFARMYSQFQFTTLLFLLCYDRTFWGGAWHRRYWTHAVGVVATLTHSSGVLLLPFLLAPLVDWRERFGTAARAARYALPSGALVVAGFLYTRVRFRNMGVTDRFPEGFVFPARTGYFLPEFPFWSVGGDPLYSQVLVLGVLAAVATLALLPSLLRGRLDFAPALAAVLLVASALHSLVIAAVCAALLIGRFEVHRHPVHRAPYVGVLAVSLAAATAWLAVALWDPSWISEVGDGTGSILGGIRKSFFGWPDLYTSAFLPWSRELPLLGGAIALSVAYQLWRNRKAPAAELARNPATILAFVCVAIALKKSPFAAVTRYFFFVYPLGLYALVLSVAQVTRSIAERRAPSALPLADLAAAALCLVLFALSSDFNPPHIARVATPEVAFRTGPFARFEPTWYWRWDYRSPAEFAAEASRGGEAGPVIVTGLPPVSYYLTGPHAIYHDRFEDRRFVQTSRSRGTVELWSSQALLSSPEDVRAHTAGATRVWIVQATDPAYQWIAAEDVWGERLRSTGRAFVSADGRIEVVAVELAAPADGPGS